MGALIGIAFLLLLAVTVTPLAVFGLGCWLLSIRSGALKTVGVGVLVGSVALAFWLWPREYVWLFRSADVPSVVHEAASTARTDLGEAGFTRVKLVSGDPARVPAHTVRVPLGSAGCTVLTSDPASGAHADKRKVVTLTLTCPVGLAPGYTRVPDAKTLQYADFDYARDKVRDAGLRVLVRGQGDDYCARFVAASPPPSSIVRRGSTVTLTRAC